MQEERQQPATPAMRLIRALTAEGYRVFTVDQARKFSASSGVSESYLLQALHHLTNSGWLVRLYKGLYALSTDTSGAAHTHEFEIAMALAPQGAISHWSAMHQHGMTEQVPRRVFVLTPIDAPISRSRSWNPRGGGSRVHVGEIVYQFVQVRSQRFFGTQKVWLGEARITITDPERTLLDGLMKPKYCGDFAEVLHAFEVRHRQIDLNRIVEYALRLGAATAKRLGWVLEHQGVTPSRLESLVKVPIKGYRTLDPSGPRKGACNSRWMIQENLPGKVPS